MALEIKPTTGILKIIFNKSMSDFSLTSVWMLDLEFNGEIKGVIVPSWRCVLDGLQRPVVIGREVNIIYFPEL